MTSTPPSRMRPAVGSISFSTMLPTVDLPQPDSPTRPSVSPAPMAKLTPSTALTTPPRRCSSPPRTGKCLTRPSTSRLAGALMPPPPPRGRLPSRPRDAPAPASIERRRRRRGSDRPRSRSAARRRSRRSAGVRAGTMPGISCRRGRAPAGIGLDVEPRERPHQAARVGMQRAARTARSTGASSTMRPAYMTTTRSQVSATTPRSWVIRMMAVPSLLLQLQHQVEDLRLDGDVERRGRLVGDQHLRIAGRAPWRS